MPNTALPGAPHLAYHNGNLTLEGVQLAHLAQQYGTPLFVYSQAAILDALAAYQRGLAGRNARICYSVKANSSLAILRLLFQAGCSFDVVSQGELERVLYVGANPKNIVFSGVGKTPTELKRALRAGIGCFNVESLAELDALNEIALELELVAPISIRINPNVDPRTHPYISTGLKESKFGIEHEQALTTYWHAAQLPGLKVIGIDCHIGSQITQVEPYQEALERILELTNAIEAAGIELEHIDFGGGLGIDYAGETPPAADNLWRALLQQFDAHGYGDRLILVEPGRSLIGNAGVCLTQTLYLKPGAHKQFCIVDAAMNDLPRPTLYNAYHRIEPMRLPAEHSQPQIYDVVGPVCESGDWIGRDRSLAVQAGDWLAVLSAGAYCMSMASNYNSRGRCAEVLIEEGVPRLIRRRETAADIWHHERF
jgi:diaminopimelate decarboxylase